MEKLGLYPKPLFFSEFSRTLTGRDFFYYSFDSQSAPSEELDHLFQQLIAGYGTKHMPVYRLCDAEYMYCLGVRMPKHKLSLRSKLSLIVRSLLVRFNLMNQRTWHGENYSATEKKRLKNKYLSDLRIIAADGFLAPHLLLSPGKFCEEYNEGMVRYFKKHDIHFNRGNFIPFYFVYVILSLKKYREQIFKGKEVLVITSFNERKRRDSFEREFAKEGVSGVSFYEISPDKSMLEVIDKSKLPVKADIVLIGAGIGSANILNQIRHLNAICIDAGHALDCFSSPQLRKERICLFPDEMEG